MKKICAVLCALCMLFVLSGCQGKCDGCGKQATVKKITIMGESANLCSDCQALISMLGNDF